MDENDESLASRVERLESDMRDLKRWARDVHVWTWGLPEELAPADQSGDAGQHGAAALAAAPAGARPMATASRAADPESEVRLVGTWFARLGALALLLGAGFAFSYAVERGLIGPAARVAIGVLAGLAMLVAGEVSRRRDWPGLAQAVSAGGLGVLTLAVWAAYSLYGLVLPVTAFASFAVITAGGVAIAIRHDSQPLAALTVIGGFLNPFLADGLEIPSGMLTYILILDAGVLVLGLRRRWRGLEWLAFTGTWLTVSTVAIDGGFEAVVGASPAPWSLRGFAMLFWALFTIHLFAAELSARRPTRGGDQVLALANGIALLAVMMELLSVSDEPWRAAFTLGMAFVHGVLGVLSTLAGRRPLAMAMYGAAVMFVTVLIPMELQGRWVAAAWAVEAVVLIVLSRGAEGARGRLVGAGLLGVSLFTSVAVHFRFGDAYRPERLIVSPESFILVIQVAALYAAAWLLLREQDGRPMAGLAAVTANVMTVGWLTLEAVAYFRGAGPVRDAFGFELTLFDHQTLQFTISAIWGLYAAALLAVGVAYRVKAARLLAVTLFGATMAKMVLKDLWFLDPLYRTVVFIGLGILLLLSSLLYHRFRGLILGDEEPERDEVKA